MAIGKNLGAKLLFVDVLSPNLEGAEKFYGTLFGVNDGFARSLTDQVEQLHMPISGDGTQLHLTKPNRKEEARTVAWYGVENLERAVAGLEAAGGKRVAGPFPVQVPDRFFGQFKEKAEKRVNKLAPGAEVKPRMGNGALVLDPNGQPVGVMELAEFAKVHFRAGKLNKGLSADQVQDHKEAQETARKAFGRKAD